MNKPIIFCLLLLLSSSCHLTPKEQSSSLDTPKTNFDYSSFELRPGDLLFQDSDCGPFCESIEKVTHGYKGSKFSHVGIVARDKNNDFKVMEAISAGVVETHLDSFFQRSFDENGNSKVAVGRLKKEHKGLIPSAIEYAKTKMGAPYDDVFDITNERYYCSELIYEAFKYANNDTPIFQLQKMTYKDPDTEKLFPIWADYFKGLGVPVPEGEPGLNPGGMSLSNYLEIVHLYGIPQGYTQVD